MEEDYQLTSDGQRAKVDAKKVQVGSAARRAVEQTGVGVMMWLEAVMAGLGNAWQGG